MDKSGVGGLVLERAASIIKRRVSSLRDQYLHGPARSIEFGCHNFTDRAALVGLKIAQAAQLEDACGIAYL